MADYRIVCVNTSQPHGHMVTVGTGRADGRASRIWTVVEVRSALEAGDTFHTVSLSTGARADVYEDTCGLDGCDVKTIRSRADGVADNNLDNLRTCGT